MSAPKFRRGVYGYAAIMRQLADAPRTSIAIAEALGVQPASIRHILRGLHHERLVYVSGWEPPKDRGCHCAVWSIGSQPDAVAPDSWRFRRPSLHPAQSIRPPRNPLVEVIAFAEMWRVLEQPIGAIELAEHMGTTRASIYRFLRAMRHFDLARIAKWERRSGVGGAPTPLWQREFNRRDAKRPAPEPNRVVIARYWQRRREREAMEQQRAEHQYVVRALAGVANDEQLNKAA